MSIYIKRKHSHYMERNWTYRYEVVKSSPLEDAYIISTFNFYINFGYLLNLMTVSVPLCVHVTVFFMYIYVHVHTCIYIFHVSTCSSMCIQSIYICIYICTNAIKYNYIFLFPSFFSTTLFVNKKQHQTKYLQFNTRG